MKKTSCVISVLIILSLLIGSLSGTAIATAEEDVFFSEVILHRGNSETVLYPERIDDHTYIVKSSEGLMNNADIRFILSLPEETRISKVYNGKDDAFDLSLKGVYETDEERDSVIYGDDNHADVCLWTSALDLDKVTWLLPGHVYSGCYYIQLDNGEVFTLIMDTSYYVYDQNISAGTLKVIAPEYVGLYNVDTEEYYADYEVCDLNQTDRGGSVVYAEIESDIPLVLKAQTVFNGKADPTKSKSGLYSYSWRETGRSWVTVNGERSKDFSSITDSMSESFTLKPGINVVEVTTDVAGFNAKSSVEWFAKDNRSTASVVYVINYTGTSATIQNTTSNDSTLNLDSLKVFSMGDSGSLISESTLRLNDDGSISFSLPAALMEEPVYPNRQPYIRMGLAGTYYAGLAYTKGVLLYLVPNDSGAIVEIEDQTESGEFASGSTVGFMHAINAYRMEPDGKFNVVVTSADGSSSSTYIFHASFLSSDTSMILSVEKGALDRDFTPEEDVYYLSYEDQEALLTYELPDDATLFVDGQPVSSSSVHLTSDKEFHILSVTAADSINTKDYYFITKLADGTVPYFTLSEETKNQIKKLLRVYREEASSSSSFGSAWAVFMAKAAADDVIDWNGKYIENLENNTANRQATDPARNILEAVLLGENPYHFDPNGDGEYRNFVEELQQWSNGGAWANNIWYAWAAKAVGLPTLFDESLKSNAISRAYDLDMRGWTVAALPGLDGIDQKNMVPYVESLKNVQVREDNPISDLKYTGLWRMVAHYSSFDTNAYTIGTVLSAIGAAGVDPDRVFAVTASDGTVYEPLDQIEKWLWEEETGTFMGEAEAPQRAFVKDMIIGLGDILQGSNVWNRCALTEEKFNDLAAKASDSAKAAALSAAELTEAPDFGGADYGKYYYFLYEAVADELEESGDTSMRPKVIWDTPVGQFRKAVAALPAETEDSFVSSVAEVIELYEKLYAADGDAFTDAVGTDTMTAYRDAVAAALEKQDSTGDTADFYKRVMALPDALLITEDSREEVDALRALYDGMTAEQRDLIDWAGASVLLRLQAAEAALGQGSGSTTMTIHFALLGAPDDGPNGTVNTLKDGNLDTWLEDDYTFNAETISAEQAFRVIMGDAGISWKGGSSNSYGTLYVSAVKNPATGEWMEEFTTGENSGWMYTVNGLHPNMGLSAYMLADGDTFIFHYTDDFTLETDPWDGTIINDEEKTGATTVITDAATGTFVVECDRACAVLAKTEDGSYVLLPATVTPGADGDIVSFTAGDYDEVLIRVKGDLNGDGAVDSTDTLMMKKLVAGLMEPDEITALLMDLTGDGIANSTDTLKMKRVAAGLDTLAW